MTTSAFWFNKPTELVHTTDLWPRPSLSYVGKLNAVSRLVLLFTVLTYLLSGSTKILLSGILTLGAIVLLYYIQTQGAGRKEGFSSPQLYDLVRSSFTEPTVPNPLMNVLLPEINDNPNRSMAAPAFLPLVETDINKSVQEFANQQFRDPNIDQRLFTDLGDSFTFDRSMRQFYANPSTTVPNNQDAFAQYCYSDMISCRDETNNELACIRTMPARWQNM